MLDSYLTKTGPIKKRDTYPYTAAVRASKSSAPMIILSTRARPTRSGINCENISAMDFMHAKVKMVS
jgi:hypothetical protein